MFERWSSSKGMAAGFAESHHQWMCSLCLESNGTAAGLRLRLIQWDGVDGFRMGVASAFLHRMFMLRRFMILLCFSLFKVVNLYNDRIRWIHPCGGLRIGSCCTVWP